MHDKWTGPELDSLLGKSALTRRDVLVTSLAIGFAAAAGPVAADTVITTGSEGLTAGEVKIPAGDIEIPAYRAMPAKGGPFPVVLVVQEIFGVHEHMKDLCRRFAKEGYLAVAPELYARQGDPTKFTDWKQLYAEVVSKVPDAQVMSDLDAAVAWAGKSGSGDVKRVGVTGFCWGGRITWLYCAHSPQVKGRRRVVRPARRRNLAAAAEVPDRRRRGAQGAGARPVRREGPGHPARGCRENACSARGGEESVRDRCVSGSGAWLQRGLPAELPRRGRARGLAPGPRLVPQARGRLVSISRARRRSAPAAASRGAPDRARKSRRQRA